MVIHIGQKRLKFLFIRQMPAVGADLIRVGPGIEAAVVLDEIGIAIGRFLRIGIAGHAFILPGHILRHPDLVADFSRFINIARFIEHITVCQFRAVFLEVPALFAFRAKAGALDAERRRSVFRAARHLIAAWAPVIAFADVAVVAAPAGIGMAGNALAVASHAQAGCTRDAGDRFARAVFAPIAFVAHRTLAVAAFAVVARAVFTGAGVAVRAKMTCCAFVNARILLRLRFIFGFPAAGRPRNCQYK